MLKPPAGTNAVVLVLHGGRERGTEPVRRHNLAYLRMVPVARALRAPGVEVWNLRYRVRGWNAPVLDPVEDARWALDEIAGVRPGAPVVLVGHSMGGRAAVRVAGHPSVIAVCALAPWIVPGEPFEQLRGRSLLIAHGDRERTTDPARSLWFARQAKTVTDRVARFSVVGDGHAMLRRAGDWTRLVVDFVHGELGLRPMAPDIAKAMREASPRGLDVPLAASRR
ncbi:Alpha/beta hydrolase family protein [Lentzea xinjiangensis]|uniref:Alpha/beta hydrolase family protein n=1 Tax=Lentzea xinjiangensis TaxID=402600 RepID=A0A1H9QWQ0_9PSEU|nr:alpha/beta fold hydrolase [Lentzea xinjiangensis]SER64914.1 Alpha/beta hydrolase family protein [Lentzea xinjiangensis]